MRGPDRASGENRTHVCPLYKSGAIPLGDRSIRNIGASLIQPYHTAETDDLDPSACPWAMFHVAFRYYRGCDALTSDSFRGKQQPLDYILAHRIALVKSLSAERTVADVPPPTEVVDPVHVHLTRLGVGNQVISLVKNLGHHIAAHVHPTCIPA